MNENRQKKNDLILIIVLLTISLVSFLFLKLNKKEGAYAIIGIDGEEVARLPLSVNTTYDLGTNIIEVKDGFVFMAYANCPDQICVHEGKIQTSDRLIVCLPNKITVSIIGDKGEVDLR